jgi:hypothetical protein
MILAFLPFSHTFFNTPLLGGFPGSSCTSTGSAYLGVTHQRQGARLVRPPLVVGASGLMIDSCRFFFPSLYVYLFFLSCGWSIQFNQSVRPGGSGQRCGLVVNQSAQPEEGLPPRCSQSPPPYSRAVRRYPGTASFLAKKPAPGTAGRY